MKSTKDIEQSIKKLVVESGNRVHDRILEKLQIKLDESKTNTPIKQTNIWRIIMKSRISKIAAAAVILVAVILGINFPSAPIDGAGTAFASAINSIKNARTFSCIVIMEKLYNENGELKKFQYKSKVMFKEPDVERREQLASPWPEEEGKTTIIDFSKRQALTILPAKKTAELYDITDGDELSTSIRDWLLEKSTGSFDDLGDVELNGQSVWMIQSKEKNWIYTIWIDLKTGYPVQIKLEEPEQNFTPILYTSIQIDAELDDKLFSLEPPEGYDLKIKETANTIDYRNNSSDDYSPDDSGKQKAFLSITDILDLWGAGYGSIHSMKVRYTEDNFLLDPNGKETILHTTVERIQDGQKFYCKFHSSNPDFPRSDSNREGAYDGEVSTSYGYYNYDMPRTIIIGEISKDIESAKLKHENSLERYMQLSRYYINPEYPDGETYFAFWVRSYLAASRKNNKFKVSVRPELETVLGEPCHVVEVGNPNVVSRFWMAHNKGLLVLKYENFDKGGQFVKNSIEVLKIAKVMTEKGEIWYPCEMEQVNVDTVMRLGRVQTFKCQVQEFIPNITDIPQETFRVKFPVGTRVFDKVRGITYTQIE
jgi:outer membrane lipoprotein-sorting protein